MGILPALLKDAVKTLFKALVRRPATEKYPEEPVEVPEGFRGRHLVELGKCVGCGLCAKDCPAGAISMVPLEAPVTGLSDTRRRFLPLKVPVIDLSKCIFCYQCAESCPKKAITPTSEFRLAVTDPHQLVLDFRPSLVKSRSSRSPP